MSWIFIGSMWTFPSLMMTPRYSVSKVSNSHFSALRNSLFFHRTFRTSRMIHQCSSLVLDMIRISSRYTVMVPDAMRSLKMSFIIHWKVAGELVSPKNITIGSNKPWLVLNAAFHSLPVLMRTLLYPHQTSSLEKYLVPRNLSISSKMRGSRYQFLIVISLSLR